MDEILKAEKTLSFLKIRPEENQNNKARIMYISVNFFLFIYLLSLAMAVSPICTAWADDLTARQIMEKVDARDDGDRQTSDMQMILIDKNGKKRIREISSFQMDKGKDLWRLMFFLSPADVEDTAFLTYDYDDPEKDDDQWLYLPALKKSKRIASSDKDGSFMGSDFTYADMTNRNIDDYDYKLLKEMNVGDQPVWLIELIPRTQKVIDTYGYTKSYLFVRKDNYVVIRAINWVKKGNKLKYMEVKSLELIDNVWMPLELQMVTKKGKQTEHSTVLKFNNVKLNQTMDEDLFTIRRMEKGL